MVEGGCAGQRPTCRDRGGDTSGAVISPLLAKIHLHYLYDLWVQAWRTRQATGDMIVARYADDTIVGFQQEGDAEWFLTDLKERLTKVALERHPRSRG
jgi:RNA-directed DNA polymerase